MQSFGVRVTAAPYFAVSIPSSTLLLQAVIDPQEKKQLEASSARLKLVPKGQYRIGAQPGEIAPFEFQYGVPLDIYQARNAMKIARRTKANEFASEGYRRAQEALNRAEEFRRDGDKKATIATAREATQIAGDAVTLAIDRQVEKKMELEKLAAADRVRRASDMAADAERRMREAMEKQAEAERAAQAARQERQRAEEASRLAIEERKRAQRDALEARRTAQQAVQEQQNLRNRLIEQLNRVLETTDTERGLVVNLSDILFDSGKFRLRSDTKVLLARIAGILSWAPGLKIVVEGHTDSTGNAGKNMELSEKRAAAVANFLVEQGILPSNISSVGYGESRPIAENRTRAGRKINRRVDLVLSGQIIGASIGGAAY
jgi:outer membrane protein OmpA-like peptidoglycan-associated protein